MMNRSNNTGRNDTTSYAPHLCLDVWLSSLAPTHCSDTTQGSHINLTLVYCSSSQVFTWPYLPCLFVRYLHFTGMISLSR